MALWFPKHPAKARGGITHSHEKGVAAEVETAYLLRRTLSQGEEGRTFKTLPKPVTYLEVWGDYKWEVQEE